MTETLLKMLRCPATGSVLSIRVIGREEKLLDGIITNVIDRAILFAENDWFYPVINGIPVLLIEAVIDHEIFLKKHLPDFEQRRRQLFRKNERLIIEAFRKNKRTKESFTQEWSYFKPDADRTWNADPAEMIERFYRETGEKETYLTTKIIFDAGCGNGLLNCLLAEKGIENIAMDFSESIGRAYRENQSSKVHFICGDVQFPPLVQQYFDIVHCSGVLIHTNNTEYSFSCIEKMVKPEGKLSVWLYHPRKNFLHNFFNIIRKFTSKLPLKLQYWLYRFTIFPLSWIIKRLKSNRQNSREMMIDILDWFTPEFRWEHTHEEVTGWFNKNDFKNISITTDDVFGFNTVGIKSSR